MPEFIFNVKALGSNAAEIYFPEQDDFMWEILLQCGSCSESREVKFTTEQKIPLKGDKSAYHFVMECKNCERKIALSVLKKQKLRCDEDQIFEGCLAVLEVRNGAPMAFTGKQITVKSVSGEEMIGNPNQFFEYDQKLKEPVTLQQFKSVFERR